MRERCYLTGQWCKIVLLVGGWASLAAQVPAAELPPASKTLPLAGSWAFRLDPEDQGVQANWFKTRLPDTIKLPGSTDENGFGTKTTEREPHWLNRVYKYVGPAWYQHEVMIPNDWRGQRIVLHLERCHWETRVWVDGQAVGMQDSLCTPHERDLEPHGSRRASTG